MKCPRCKEETKVLEKRNTPEADSIRRRRECLGCGFRFTTYEKIEETALVVIKKGGEREAFSKEKYIGGILKAIEKRPIDMIQVDRLYKDVSKELREKASGNEIKSNQIGEITAEKLKEIDEVAYMRFASVYRAFKDLESFEKELKVLRNNNN